MHETFHKWVGHTLCDFHTIIVVRLVPYIEHRLLYIPHAMTEKINRYHRYAIAVGVAVLQNVVWVGILSTKILTETQCLRLKPCLLQLYQHKLQTAIILTNLRPEIDAEHRNLVTSAVGIFMLTHLYFCNFTLQKSRKHYLCHAVVLHKVLEHRIINRICNTYYHNCFLSLVGAKLGK